MSSQSDAFLGAGGESPTYDADEMERWIKANEVELGLDEPVPLDLSVRGSSTASLPPVPPFSGCIRHRRSCSHYCDSLNLAGTAPPSAPFPPVSGESLTPVVPPAHLFAHRSLSSGTLAPLVLLPA